MADGEPKLDITVSLTTENGNAHNILGVMIAAMRRAKVPNDKIEEFKKDAMSKDYDHLLQTCMHWVNVT